RAGWSHQSGKPEGIQHSAARQFGARAHAIPIRVRKASAARRRSKGALPRYFACPRSARVGAEGHAEGGACPHDRGLPVTTRALSADPPLALFFEERQIDGVGHRLVAGGVQVQVVAAVVGGRKPQWVGRICYDRGEVEGGVEPAAVQDPVVHLLAELLVLGAIVARAAEW